MLLTSLTGVGKVPTDSIMLGTSGPMLNVRSSCWFASELFSGMRFTLFVDKVTVRRTARKGVERLVERGFLDDSRKVGRKRLIVLTPSFRRAIPGAGVREHRDEIAFQAEIAAGLAMIQGRE
jgi:hypothetical protein